jgi:two-component system, LytTR family, response regulator
MNDITLNCLVLDDEQHALNVLIEHIKDTPFLNLVAATTRPIEAIKIMGNEPVDLIFLDVQMPGINGIDFIKLIQGNCHVILCSAYKEFAMDGFENDVIDFLLKPITYTRFIKGVQKVVQLVKQTQSVKIEYPDTDNHIFVKNGIRGKVIKLPFDELLFAEAQKNYVTFHLISGKIITYMTITDAEAKLPPKLFLRVQRSYIIRLDRVIMIEGNMVSLKYTDVKVPIGDTYKEKLFELLKIE